MYAPDLRGQGRSLWSPPWTREQHVADVVATMDMLGLRQVDVLGFSFGAAVSSDLAHQAPERVRRLVLLDPAVGLEAEGAATSAAKALEAPSFLDPAEARATVADVDSGHQLLLERPAETGVLVRKFLDA
ncbi:alpha/beta fold hydrolase [Streptomyces sp. NPDC048636]|uniref:alpha/beta fold hydrolase n=1 Tax=Streptomyces sp. NPDC048636 TaxID=3155762 RepID=UPI00343817F7